MKFKNGTPVETFNAANRVGMSIRASVELWMKKDAPPPRPTRKRAFVDDSIAPDGKPYSMPFKMIKPKGAQ